MELSQNAEANGVSYIQLLQNINILFVQKKKPTKKTKNLKKQNKTAHQLIN